MKEVKMKKIVLFILASFYAINMYALGTETSGGGGAAVCRDQYKNITSAYLLDLYEGKYRFNLNIPQTAQNPDDQIIKAISKIQDPVIKQLIKQTIADIINRASFLPNGVSLSPSTDLGKDYGAVVPDGCVIEPIGFYESSGVLKISKSIYKALSETDKAAFFVHEAIYKLARDMVYQQDSALSRKLVATMFSTQTIEVEKALEGLFKESWNYWNYHQLSSIKLYNFLDTVDLSVKLDSSKFKEVDSISIECASSQNTYQ